MMSSADGHGPEHGAQLPDVPESRSAEARVEAARTALQSLSSRPLTEHAPVYEGLHEQLQAVLAEIDGA